MDFIIFEDRKFADIGEFWHTRASERYVPRTTCVGHSRDYGTRQTFGPSAHHPLAKAQADCIGNTVTLQYSSGVHQIASWSHLTNAHPLPGPGIISGLSSVGLPLGRALLLLAEMSSKDNLATGDYTKSAVKMARDAGREFVIGFIAMGRVDAEGRDEDEDYLIMTPGVGMVSTKTGDKLGQQYRTPREVVYDSGCDVIIVGRGIYGIQGGEEKVKEEAERYRAEGWAAYEERLGKK
jgi:orotidine-5'-phosphate decarboxylase